MTWKAYAAVSGATVVAGWLAAAPSPSNAPESATARREPAALASIEHSDIEEQASRLQARLREHIEYNAPARNPFRFAAREAPGDGGGAPPPSSEPVVAPPPPPPPLTLSGVADDQVAGRTAILSSPSGVLLAREGDELLGQYRVARIEDSAVEIVRLVDGTSVRIALKP